MKMIVYAVEVAERPLLERYGKQFGWELTLLAEKPEQNNAAQAEGMDVVNVLSSTYITPKLLDAYRAGGVKMVVSRTVGVEHIDVAYANAVGIAVGNAPYSPASVADYAIMMMLMVLRHIKPMLLRYAGQDYTAGYLGRELPNLTVGIVGLGRIGETVARHLQGFGCRILGWNRTPRADLSDLVEAVELDEPPQAARPRAAVEAPATFRKLRREIIFFIVVLLLLLVNICHRPQHEDGS